VAEIQTLDEALAYLSPHPLTNGPVILTPEKMREAVGVIQSSLAAERERCAAVVESGASWSFYDGGRALRAAAAAIRNLPSQTEGGKS
jgi:hypothetical protein